VRHDTIYTAWTVKCRSEADTRRLREAVASLHNDASWTDVVRAFPGGVESRWLEPHRIGDYFGAVRAFPGAPGAPASFRILFHRQPGAGRYWKDFMVNLLHWLRRLSPDIEITVDYRGDEAPAEMADSGR
jgi:hypothetical protein